MRLFLQTILCLVVFVLMSAGVAVSAEDVASQQTTAFTSQDVLDRYKSLLWQKINEARQNPRAVLQRLEISEELAVATLGDDAWILDQGLRPLAWDARLHQAASAHGRDMLSRLYYNHYSPDGLGPADRIVATDYQAVDEEENLGALFFKNYVDIETATTFMIDTLLRDELTPGTATRRAIFNPDFSEVGVALFAETVPLLEGEPYVYLLVINYAQPVEPRGFIVGQVDPGLRVAMRKYTESLWALLPVYPGDAIQVPFPQEGVRLVTIDDHGDIVSSQDVFDFNPYLNRLVDMRSGGASVDALDGN